MKQGWEIKKLGEVCTIERGGSPRPIQNYLTEADDGINWIKIGDATEGSKHITSTKEKIKPEGMKKSRFVHKGDFILSNSMSFGRPYILAVDGCIHDGWLVIHDNDNRFDKNYLYYYLGSPNIYTEFKRLAVGGVVNNLNSELVRNVKVCIPPLAEQEKIVAELDCLSGVIEKKKQQLKELDALAESIFYTMFGDPITNEKGWKVKKLGEVCTSDLGKTLDSKKNKGELYNYLCSINVQWGYFDLTTLKEMRFEESELERYLVKKGDLLICEGGDTGRCSIWNSDETMYYQNALHRVRFKDKTILPIFCQYVMQYLKNNGEIDKYSKGQTIKHLVKSALMSIPIPVPPLPLQQGFADKIEAIEKQKELIKQSITETEELFNSRMDYYFG